MIEKTFAMVKPDGVQRGFVGKILARFEDRGLKVTALKMMKIPRELSERHYEEHKGKSFYEPLLSYITSGPVVCMVLEGENAVAAVRAMMGKTNPQDAAPGTIRADFGQVTGRNIVHGSDSPESAKREIKLFFNDYEMQKYEKIDEAWLFEK
ncbi:MAG: nucleoside-diphosphate kinase [Euryarchaeota archaeon RBG_13_61_15]|nr:MAG: nucleoside-diphosphate kinase [Euryarchaeota archaeon RBG_13_61_15]